MRGAFHWIDRWRLSDAYKTMTLAEQGAYRNLLDELWLSNGVLPTEDRLLARLCGVATEWKKVRGAVMAKFYLTPEGWRNKTHDEVSAESRRRADKQKRYRERAQKDGNDGGNESGNVTPSQFSVHRSPRINGSTTAPPSPRAKAETREALRAAITELSTIVGRDFDRVAEAVTSGKARTGKRQCQPCINLERISEDQAKRSILDANTLIEQAKAEA